MLRISYNIAKSSKVVKLAISLAFVGVSTSLLSFIIERSFKLDLSYAHDVVISDLKNKSRKALVFDNYEELRTLKDYFSSDKIGFVLKDFNGIVVDSHYPFISQNTITYRVNIEGLSNDIAIMLIENKKFDDKKITGKSIGDLEVYFTYSSPLFIYSLPISLMVSVFLLFSVHAIFLSKSILTLKKALGAANNRLVLLQAKSQFSSEVLTNIFDALSTDLKKATDVLSHFKKDKDSISEHAHEKIQFTINGLLEVKENILNYSKLDSSPAETEVYFLGNLSSSTLALGLKVNNIILKELDLLSTKDIENKTINLLIDLDPLENDEDKVLNIIERLPSNIYIVGLIPQSVQDIPHIISDKLNWTLKQPLTINAVVEAIKNKPSFDQLLEDCFIEN